jgi:hypothetical protein
MRTNPTVCRLIVYLCVAFTLVLVVTHPVLSLVLACLIPFWFFINKVVIPTVVFTRKNCKILSVPFLPVFSPRPPPAN